MILMYKAYSLCTNTLQSQHQNFYQKYSKKKKNNGDEFNEIDERFPAGGYVQIREAFDLKKIIFLDVFLVIFYLFSIKLEKFFE